MLPILCVLCETSASSAVIPFQKRPAAARREMAAQGVKEAAPKSESRCFRRTRRGGGGDIDEPVGTEDPNELLPVPGD
jgi:hypothetical protein